MSDLTDWSPVDSENGTSFNQSSEGAAPENWTGSEVNDSARARMGAWARHYQNQRGLHEFARFLKGVTDYGVKTITASSANQYTISNNIAAGADVGTLFPEGARLVAFQNDTPVANHWVKSANQISNTIVVDVWGETTSGTANDLGVQVGRTMAPGAFAGFGTKSDRDTASTQGMPDGALWFETDTFLISVYWDAQSGWREFANIGAWQAGPGSLELRDATGGGLPGLNLRQTAGNDQGRLDIGTTFTRLQHYSSVDQSLQATLQFNDDGSASIDSNGQLSFNGGSARTLFYQENTSDATFSVAGNDQTAIPGWSNRVLSSNVIGAANVQIQMRAFLDRNGAGGIDQVRLYTHAAGDFGGTSSTERLRIPLSNNASSLRSIQCDAVVDASSWDATNDANYTWALNKNNSGTQNNVRVGGSGATLAITSFDDQPQDDSQRKGYFTMEPITT